MKTKWVPMTRIILLAAVALALCLGASCKKTDEPVPPAPKEPAAAAETTAEPAVQPVAQTPEPAKPVEPALGR